MLGFKRWGWGGAHASSLSQGWGTYVFIFSRENKMPKRVPVLVPQGFLWKVWSVRDPDSAKG